MIELLEDPDLDVQDYAIAGLNLGGKLTIQHSSVLIQDAHTNETTRAKASRIISNINNLSHLEKLLFNTPANPPDTEERQGNCYA